MSTPTTITEWDAVMLSRAIADRTVSCLEVMDAYLAPIERLNPTVNAIVSRQDPAGLRAEARARDDELARGHRRGALHGFPQAIKDLTATKGIATTQGSTIWRDTVPEADAIMVERMRESGAVFLGKTNVPEFGLGSNTFNPVFGPTLNAYDQSRTAGGSSGGAAVALALRMLPVADGSDHAGSLRNPAAYNNVFGLRPSYGRVPAAGDEVFLPALGVAGPMARTVPDLALLLSVQAGYDARMPNAIEEDPAVFTRPLERDMRGLRVGWLGDMGGRLPLEAGIFDLCEAGLRVFEELGAEVEPAAFPFSPEALWENWMVLRAWTVAETLGPIYADPALRAQMKPEAQWEAQRGTTLSAHEVYRASQVRSAYYQAMRQLFARYDVLVLPSAQVFPFPVGTHWPKTIAGRTMDTYHRWMEVMIPFTMANSPAISVPVGFGPEGLPMGMQIAGPNHAEWTVMQVAHAYDQATGWVTKRRPALLQRDEGEAR